MAKRNSFDMEFISTWSTSALLLPEPLFLPEHIPEDPRANQEDSGEEDADQEESLETEADNPKETE